MKILIYIILALVVIAAALLGLIWFSTFHPPAKKTEPVRCDDQAPVLTPGQTIKVLSWNVQFMAGKGYHFFYEGGTDTRPEPGDIAKTLDAVAEVIRDEDPDIVLLQEVDVNARRTDYMNQVKKLARRLPDAYRCRASSYYWKADFVPHPKIMGSVGMKLVTFSKYRIDSAMRHQLPLIPESTLRQQFNLKRAVLVTRLPVTDNGDFAVLNTHLSAFAQGTNALARQVDVVKSLMDRFSANAIPWIAGGDFNLLPPGKAYQRLSQEQKYRYQPESRLKPIFEDYQAVPGLEDISGKNRRQWYTHFPNDPAIKTPNKTIDYIFYADTVAVGPHYVRRRDTAGISDHLPVVAEFVLPKTEPD
ncbi:MAG: endonuclease/exonuclease/phosphatase family protein [Thermodesulfobacteriota bacterium]